MDLWSIHFETDVYAAIQYTININNTIHINMNSSIPPKKDDKKNVHFFNEHIGDDTNIRISKIAL